MDFMTPMVVGVLTSLLQGLKSNFGIAGLVALGAAIVLFFGAKKFLMTPRGMLVAGGVLAVAVLFAMLNPSHTMRAANSIGKKVASHASKAKAAAKEHLRKANAEAGRQADRLMHNFLASAGTGPVAPAVPFGASTVGNLHQPQVHGVSAATGGAGGSVSHGGSVGVSVNHVVGNVAVGSSVLAKQAAGIHPAAVATLPSPSSGSTQLEGQPGVTSKAFVGAAVATAAATHGAAANSMAKSQGVVPQVTSPAGGQVNVAAASASTPPKKFGPSPTQIAIKNAWRSRNIIYEPSYPTVPMPFIPGMGEHHPGFAPGHVNHAGTQHYPVNSGNHHAGHH